MRTALKEWAVVVDALGRGEQILILRKGGIRDASGLFRPQHNRFWLYPTAFHQQAESVVEHAAERFRAEHNTDFNPDQIPLQYVGEVQRSLTIHSLTAALALAGQHIWHEDVIRNRFNWGREQGIHLLIVRVHQRSEPEIIIPHRDYGGCRSWIELTADPDESGLQPVLSDAAFATMERKVEDALQTATKAA